MTDSPWVLAIGEAVDEAILMDALVAADEHFETSSGLLSDLGPECGLDWALVGVQCGRRVRALLPWAPFDADDIETRDALIDEVEDVDFWFEGTHATWVRDPRMYESGRAFVLWELMARADLVIIFYAGQLPDFLRRMARCARFRNTTVWGYDTDTGAYTPWHAPHTKRAPLDGTWPV